MTLTKTHHFQTHHKRKRNVIRIRSIKNTGEMTRQTNYQGTILICLTTVITDTNDSRNKSARKKDQIRLCAHLMSKFLMKAYKSKIIRFKMYEDPLQCQIYFLTFLESLEMILSQYTENCEVFLN